MARRVLSVTFHVSVNATFGIANLALGTWTINSLIGLMALFTATFIVAASCFKVETSST